MKKAILILAFFISFSLDAMFQKLKVLHITFHQGCKNDFQDVAQELELDLTSWYVQSLPQDFWEGYNSGNEIYNVSHHRAQRIWQRHKDFFNQFDVIITSDTAPLSRIFIQNNWQKPLIIWVCNRFDYRHAMGGPDHFPDQEYYDLIEKATRMKNVYIISYTPYEYEYARRKGIHFGRRTIKPLGKKEGLFNGECLVPDSIEKEKTLFVFPRLSNFQMQLVLNECKHRNILAWSGVYNGPEELKQFKGVIFFPYAFSNLALFENLLRGVIHFVPTQRFLQELGFVRGGMYGNLDWCEWYFDIYREYFVFFDSWQELAHKIALLDYQNMRKKIRAFGEIHRHNMLIEWHHLFLEIAKTIQ